MKARRGQLVRCYGSVENTEIIGGAVESVNESISTLMNRSKCSLVAFDYMYRTWMVLLSEVERKPSYSAVAVDGPIYFKNTEIIRCSSIECKWVHFDSYEPIKVFTRSVRLYVSNMDGLVVWSDRSVFHSAKTTTKMTTIPTKILPPSSNDRFRPKSNRL